MRSVRFLIKGHLTQREQIVTLTNEGKLFADHISAELFITDLEN